MASLSAGIYRSRKNYASFLYKKVSRMTCFNPITVWKNPKANLDDAPEQYYQAKKVSFKRMKNWIEMTIPCGKCLGCRLDHANDWATRMTMESKQWKKCCFVTLTYNEKNRPKDHSLHEKDVQDFLKRLRFHEKGIEEWENPITGKIERPIRYFYCGEYGDKNGREHYHLAIYNWQPDDLKKYKPNKHGQMIFTSKKIYDIWGKGFAPVEELTYASACYIARYVQKKAGLKGEKMELTGEIEEIEKIDERNGKPFIHIINKRKKPEYKKRPEFIRMSQGLGLKYWLDNQEKIKRNKGIMIKIGDEVKIKSIPRYFLKKWEKKDWEELWRHKTQIAENYQKTKEDILKKISVPKHICEKEKKWAYYLKSYETNLRQKTKCLKRDEFI